MLLLHFLHLSTTILPFRMYTLLSIWLLFFLSAFLFSSTHCPPHPKVLTQTGALLVHASWHIRWALLPRWAPLFANCDKVSDSVFSVGAGGVEELGIWIYLSQSPSPPTHQMMCTFTDSCRHARTCSHARKHAKHSREKELEKLSVDIQRVLYWLLSSQVLSLKDKTLLN